MQFQSDSGPIDIRINRLIVAGWTGRDANAVQHHVDELAAIGVAPPSTVPLFYRVSHRLLTQDSALQMLGKATSGEAEPLLIQSKDALWLGLASDHTDRALETTSVAASKQICEKPCADTLWDFNSIVGHLDQLTLKSWIFEDDAWIAYQDGNLAQIRPLPDLVRMADLSDGAAMLCGTVSAIGGVRSAAQFKATLHDPVTNKSIDLTYTTQALPIVN